MNHTRHTHIRNEIERLKKASTQTDDEDTKMAIEDEIDAYEIELLTMGDDEEIDFDEEKYQQEAQERLDDVNSANQD